MRSFRKPNLNAPRYRKKVYRTYNEEFYKKFLEKYPKYKGYTYSELKKIIWHCHDQLQKEIIENRDGIELEQSLGFMFIGTCPRTTENRDIIDYGKSIKYGVIVSHKNWETDGKVAKIFYWSWAEKYHYRNRDVWGFTACRNFKRTVSKEYPLNWTMYHIVDPKKKIREQFKKTMRKDYAIKNEQERLKNYNDFEI
jgi:hypothetical protein